MDVIHICKESIKCPYKVICADLNICRVGKGQMAFLQYHKREPLNEQIEKEISEVKETDNMKNIEEHVSIIVLSDIVNKLERRVVDLEDRPVRTARRMRRRVHIDRNEHVLNTLERVVNKLDESISKEENANLDDVYERISELTKFVNNSEMGLEKRISALEEKKRKEEKEEKTNFDSIYKHIEEQEKRISTLERIVIETSKDIGNCLGRKA